MALQERGEGLVTTGGSKSHLAEAGIATWVQRVQWQTGTSTPINITIEWHQLLPSPCLEAQKGMPGA